MPIFRNSTIFIEKDKESYNNPILYTDNPLLSGYISEENIDLLKSTSPIKINKIGKGKVIYLPITQILERFGMEQIKF